MLNILFKNVGQGDSIILEWTRDDKTHWGIIDANLFNNQNPVLDEIVKKEISYIDFIILSHLHFDHYSGLAQILKHCIQHNIQIGGFYHTFTNDIAHLLDLMADRLGQRKQQNTSDLLSQIEDGIDRNIIGQFEAVSQNSKPILLCPETTLSFWAPNGIDSFKFSKQRAKYKSKKAKTVPDFNLMSTLLEISTDDKCIILTADAPKSSFTKIARKIKSMVVLAQVPHHGSSSNLEKDFWLQLTKSEDCKSIFSVGKVPKDRLPNKDVVEFFHNKAFFNMATNFVYGLEEFYGSTVPVTNLSQNRRNLLSTFGKLRASNVISTLNPRFNGDQLFKNIL